jgi:hypothetical protein
MTVRWWQARAAKTTAGIEHTQQWAVADGGLVGCKVEAAATTTVAILLRSQRQDWMVDCMRRVCRCMQGMVGGGQHNKRGLWMMQGNQAGGGQHGKRGGVDNTRQAGGGRQDERTGAEATTQDSSGGLATWLPLCTAWGGHLSRHWVLHGGGDGTWSSYVVANRMQLVTCSSAGGPWASVPHEISFLVLFLTSGIEYVFY